MCTQHGVAVEKLQKILKERRTATTKRDIKVNTINARNRDYLCTTVELAATGNVHWTIQPASHAED